MAESSVFGDNFDDFMKEEGVYEEARELAEKKMIAYQLEQEMKAQHLTKTAIAKKMNTSRMTVDNILDPSYNSSVETLSRFAKVLGKRLTISLSQ
jgi:transcriptional regulator with XRE-family HTH domain